MIYSSIPSVGPLQPTHSPSFSAGNSSWMTPSLALPALASLKWWLWPSPDSGSEAAPAFLELPNCCFMEQAAGGGPVPSLSWSQVPACQVTLPTQSRAAEWSWSSGVASRPSHRWPAPAPKATTLQSPQPPAVSLPPEAPWEGWARAQSCPAGPSGRRCTSWAPLPGSCQDRVLCTFAAAARSENTVNGAGPSSAGTRSPVPS